MTRISKRIIGWLLGAVAIVAIALGIAFTRPQTKTVSADTAVTFSTTVCDDGNADDGVFDFRLNTSGVTWTNSKNDVAADAWSSIADYTTVNGRTITEINNATTSENKIWFTLQPADQLGLSFLRLHIPNTIISGHSDVRAIGVLDGWSFNDGAATYTSTAVNFLRVGDGFALAEDYTEYTKKTGITIGDVSLEENAYKVNIEFGESLVGQYDSMYTGAYNNWLKLRQFIYINGKSIEEWNTQMIAQDAKYGDPSTYSEFPQNSTDAKHIPVFCKPVVLWGTDTGFQLCIWKDIVDLSPDLEVTVGQGWRYQTDDTEYAWVLSERVSKKLIDREYIEDELSFHTQGELSSGTQVYLIRAKHTYWTAAPQGGCLNEHDWQLSGAGQEQMHYIYFNGTSLAEINANDDGSYGSEQDNIKNGGRYAPIMAFMGVDGGYSYIQLHIPTAYYGTDANKTSHESIKIAKGFYVTVDGVIYTVNQDVEWINNNGTWTQVMREIETTVEDARIFGTGDTFAGIKLVDNDYADAGNTYSGNVRTAREYTQTDNFKQHVLINDTNHTGNVEAYLNVWNNFGYFTFRTGTNAEVTKITIKKGLQLPTYKNLSEGVAEVYVVTEDVTFVKNAEGEWEQAAKEDVEVNFTSATLKDASDATYGTSIRFDTEGLQWNTYHNWVSAEDWASIADYTYINGKSVTEINAGITSGQKLTLMMQGAGSFSFLRVYIPADVMSVDEVVTMSIKEGWSFNNGEEVYTSSSTVDFYKDNASAMQKVTNKLSPSDVTIADAYVGGTANELYIIDVTFEGLTFTCNNYDLMYAGYLTQRMMITVNGVSIYHINKTTDDSGYVYSTGPMNNADQANFGHPIIIETHTTNGKNPTNKLSVWIHKDYIATLGENVDVVITVESGFAYNGVGLAEDVSATVLTIKAPVFYTVTVDDVEQTVGEGRCAVEPETPADYEDESYEYTFDNWYIVDTDIVFSFSTAINQNYNVESRFTKTLKPTKIETTVDDVQFFYIPDNNPFWGIKVEDNDYAAAGDTYSGSSEKNALYYAKSSNFLSHVYIDGVALTASTQPGEAFLNVWNNLGYFTIRKGETYNNATEITIKAGLELPTYNNLNTGANEVYVITEDATFIKYNGAWVNKAKLAIEETGVLAIEFQNNTNVNDGKDNWLVFALDNHDYGDEAAKTDSALYQVTIAELQRIGFLDNVVLKGEVVVGDEIVTEATLAEIGLKRTALIAYWGGGLIGVQLADLVSYDSIETIIIKENCTFPSYQYACLGSEIDTRYVVLSAMEFNFISWTESETTAGAYNSLYGSDSKIGYDISMAEGAAVRLKGSSANTSGIRFQTNISKATLESLQEKLADEVYESVSFGTLIVPTDYLMGGNFTHEWLKNNYGENGYIDIESTAGFENGWPVETDEYVSFFGSIVKLNESNYSRKFSGVGYIKVVKSNGETVYFYATYNSAYSRSAAFIANAAMADRNGTQTESYPYYIEENGNYSPYAQSERNLLKGYITWTELTVPFVDAGVEGNTFTLNSNGVFAGTDEDTRNTETLPVNKSLAGAYVMLNYQTNIDVWGKFYYKSASSAEVAEDFYLQKGTSQHKQFLDLFRKNGVGKLAGITTTDTITLTKIEFRNATVDNTTLSTGTLKVFSLYSSARTINASEQEIYLTTTDGSITVGAHLGLGGALTYLAKAGISEWTSSSKRVIGLGNGSGGSDILDGSSSSEAGTGVNLINNRDAGRQIQQAWYAAVGGSDDETNGENGYTRISSVTDGDTKYWPYNPVQGGDTDSNPSQIIDYEHNKEKGYIYVKTRAMDWAYQDQTDASGNVTGSTTKSYMENYYRLDNTNNTVVVNNSFIDWNGFTDMDTCDFASNELPATYPVHTLNYFFSYVGSDTSWTEDLYSTAELGQWNTEDNYTQSNDGSLKGKKMENWFAWANDASGSVALGMYIPNIHRFVSGRSLTTTSTSIFTNGASANRNANSCVLFKTDSSGNKLASNMPTVKNNYQSCYVSNTSYTAPAISYRMEAYVPIEYTYVLCVDSVASMRTKFHAIEQSGKVTNAGSKAGERVGLDAWARQDKLWTQV